MQHMKAGDTMIVTHYLSSTKGQITLLAPLEEVTVAHTPSTFSTHVRVMVPHKKTPIKCPRHILRHKPQI